MRKINKYMITVMAAFSFFTLSGCSQNTGTTSGSTAANSSEAATNGSETASGSDKAAKNSADGEKTELLIAAAASMKPVMDEVLIPNFMKLHPEYKVSGTYDGSGKLQTQIEQGLDADLFLSAATKQMDALNSEGLIKPDTISMLLENKIVLIVPAGSESGYTTFTDIQKAQTIAIGDPDSVPVGQYTKEALENLGLYDSLKDRFSMATSVTEVLNWVAEHSADAGIVYATDAATTDKVTVIAAAPEGSLHQKVLYPIGILAGSKHQDGAALFLDYLKSSEASKAFTSYGFTPVTASEPSAGTAADQSAGEAGQSAGEASQQGEAGL